jgi:hypothetical protein
MLNLSLSGFDPADLNRAVKTTEIPQCSRLFATPVVVLSFWSSLRGE